jgi:hypothetical protein
MIPNGSMDFNMQLYMETIGSAYDVPPIMAGWRSSLRSKFQWMCFFSNFPICTTKMSFVFFLPLLD